MSATRNPLPGNVKIKYVKAGTVSAGLFKPAESRRNIIMLYFHGGGYAVGSVKTHLSLVAKIAKTTKIRALSIDYRLAPENPFPAALDDAMEAYQWLLDEGYEAKNIIFAGDSAGGGLTLAMMLNLLKTDLPMPGCAVCMSPWTDLTGTTNSAMIYDELDPMLKSSELPIWGKNYAGDRPVTYPLISPLYANPEDLKKLPPTLIQVGNAEILKDDGILFAEKMKKAGGNVILDTWDDMFHVWQFFWPFMPEATKAIKKIGSYINARVG